MAGAMLRIAPPSCSVTANTRLKNVFENPWNMAELIHKYPAIKQRATTYTAQFVAQRTARRFFRAEQHSSRAEPHLTRMKIHIGGIQRSRSTRLVR
jgi:hypothetical protein